MISVLCISDIVLDPVVKEIRSISGDDLSVSNIYAEDMISQLLSLNEEDIEGHDIVFLHSDQLFHKKDLEWQNMYFDAVKSVAERIKKKVLVSNAFSNPYKGQPLKSSFGKIPDSFVTYHETLGSLASLANIFFFDFIDVCMRVGFDQCYNYNLGHLYQMPYTKPAIKELAPVFCEQVKFLTGEEKKAIIIDCDNTLWKGIVGEDGIDGIKCDKNADGILHYELQLFLKQKKEEGFLLCLCSKNNEDDVKEVFEMRNLPLKWQDFIVKKVNWEDKITNITNTAKELNIGVDSFIFLDDNPFELNSIKELLSGVTCIHITPEYKDLLKTIDRFVFRRKQILKADIEKTKQYEIEQLRKEEETTHGSLDEFIEKLNINLDIKLNDTADFLRLSQMTAKTNQFNFNKKDYSVDELHDSEKLLAVNSSMIMPLQQLRRRDVYAK